ncbi:hypothetical protein B0A52_08590 [Exophiala mesophila]|uniref:3-hydroxyacyl-CoA dehydrogenase NAD binding domain-containing protein n=1 Tax=Exophiala mesophila TaxID=212818 RepID=A0A438MVM7_EXOME|nr:hypothetical protein B0A52_08590 [Exophiala mesophila]
MSSSEPQLPHPNERITLIGLGAIGISFLALHLRYTSAQITVYDPRPDLEDHITSILPLYLSGHDLTVDEARKSGRLHISTSLESAISRATIIQEQGPERVEFKQNLWRQVLNHADTKCRLWSSTSGIEASRQLAGLEGDGGGDDDGSTTTTTWADQVSSARSRLLIVHPFNPPHIMPLLELVPSPWTDEAEVSFAQTYFSVLASGHRPIVVHKEIKGFVANRLSFILLREACHLVDQGVVSVQECDEIIRASLGPRWAVKGIFEMYGFGGGNAGIKGFFNNIGHSIADVWEDDPRHVKMDIDGTSASSTAEAGTGGQPSTWLEKVIAQSDEAFGLPTPQAITARDRGLNMVVKAQAEIQRLDRQDKES